MTTLNHSDRHKILRTLIPVLQEERVRLEKMLNDAGYQSIVGEEIESPFEAARNQNPIGGIRNRIVTQVMSKGTLSSRNGKEALQAYDAKDLLMLDLTECHPRTSKFLIPESDRREYQDNPGIYEFRTRPVPMEEFFSNRAGLEKLIHQQGQTFGIEAVLGSSHLHHSLKKEEVNINDPSLPGYIISTGAMIEGQARALTDFMGCISDSADFPPQGTDLHRASLLRLCKDNVELRRTKGANTLIENEIHIIPLLAGAAAGHLYDRETRAGWGVVPYATTHKINFGKQREGPDLTTTKHLLSSAHVQENGMLDVSKSYLYICIVNNYLDELRRIFREIQIEGGVSESDHLQLAQHLKRGMDRIGVVHTDDRYLLGLDRGDLNQQNYDFMYHVAGRINHLIPINSISEVPYVPDAYGAVSTRKGGTPAQYVSRFERSELLRTVLSPKAHGTILETLKKMYGSPTQADQLGVSQNEEKLRRDYIPDKPIEW